MAIQTVELGTLPDGVGGDTPRSAMIKINDNFANTTHAASRLVGTNWGNVMEFGAFGLGVSVSHSTDKLQYMAGFQGLSASATGLSYPLQCVTVGWEGGVSVIGVSSITKKMFFGTFEPNNTTNFNTGLAEVLSTANTQVDTSNGYIKGASPIVKLFTDKIELNDEAKLQPITLEKLGVGDYLIKGSLGFAQEGWYIETPRDANGNVLVAVVYEQLANNDISVKTYDYMLNKKGRIVPDLETPLDIPATRWIDLRLQALPQLTQPLSADETVATNAE